MCSSDFPDLFSVSFFSNPQFFEAGTRLVPPVEVTASFQTLTNSSFISHPMNDLIYPEKMESL
jgi:hypothetical protein